MLLLDTLRWPNQIRDRALAKRLRGPQRWRRRKANGAIPDVRTHEVGWGETFEPPFRRRDFYGHASRRRDFVGVVLALFRQSIANRGPAMHRSHSRRTDRT